jgi:CO dehydrogenase/acetyl-CoA synthase delta subunit
MTDLIDKQKLDNALRRMGKKDLKPAFREFWTPERPTTGYCYVVAEVVYHYLAPKGSRPHVIRLGGTDTHWFVKDPAGNILDLTADQFDEPCDYSRGRPQNFMTPGISKRGKKLAGLLGLTKLE